MKTINNKDLYIVSVDSRGKCSSDMTCYTEHICSGEFFEQHIHDNPRNVCVKSQVAGFCGLDLTIYFHEHSPFHQSYHEDFKVSKSLCDRTNDIATLLTFNPATGYYNHLVLGKAYVLLNDGTSPLSSQQVWGIQELIREGKQLYHKDGALISYEAHMELLTWTAQYQASTWTPHIIYTPRHEHRPRFYHYESGLSDQATCHHGLTHIHHDGHHKCCHSMDDDFEGGCEGGGCEGGDCKDGDCMDVIVDIHHIVSRPNSSDPLGHKAVEELHVFGAKAHIASAVCDLENDLPVFIDRDEFPVATIS